LEAVAGTNGSKMLSKSQSDENIFELSESLIDKRKKQAVMPANFIWRDVVEDVRTVIQKSKGYIYIPALQKNAF
jgi:hypothetical protein